MATIINSGNKKRTLGMSFNPMLAEVASDDDLDLYFNPKTQARAQQPIAPQYDPEDELKGFGGSDKAAPFDTNLNFNQNTVKNQQNLSNMFASSPEEIGGRIRTNAIASLASQNNSTEYDEFQSTRRENDPMPERDAERDARNRKIGKIRAIAQGAVLLRDIIASNNGGFAMGAIGGEEGYIQALQSADDDYNQRLNMWSQKNLANQEYNDDLDKQERLMSFNARQKKQDQDFEATQKELDRIARASEGDKDRGVDELRIGSAKNVSEAERRKYEYQDRKETYERRREAINNLQKERDAKMIQLKSLKYDESERKPILLSEIAKMEEEILRMNSQLGEWEGFDQEETPTTKPSGKLGSFKSETLNLNGADYTIDELLSSGWTPEQIQQYSTKKVGSFTGKSE